MTEKKLYAVSRAIFSVLGEKEMYCDICLVSEKEMVRLEKFFFPDKKREPNVLAFPIPKDFPAPSYRGWNMVGEIYLNRDRYGKEFSHLVFLLIHGILHLLGYRHERKRDMMIMEDMERSVMEKIKKRLPTLCV